jgi:hypothetical protein
MKLVETTQHFFCLFYVHSSLTYGYTFVYYLLTAVGSPTRTMEDHGSLRQRCRRSNAAHRVMLAVQRSPQGDAGSPAQPKGDAGSPAQPTGDAGSRRQSNADHGRPRRSTGRALVLVRCEVFACDIFEKFFMRTKVHVFAHHK